MAEFWVKANQDAAWDEREELIKVASENGAKGVVVRAGEEARVKAINEELNVVIDEKDIHFPVADNINDAKFALEMAGGVLFSGSADEIEEVNKYVIEAGVTEGVTEGIQEGIQEGIEEGIQEGIQLGIQEGVGQGISEGIEKGTSRGFIVGMDEASKEIQDSFKLMQAHTEAEDVKIAQRGGIFFAMGIGFLVLCGIYGVGNPALAIIMGALAAVSLTVGMFYLSPH